MALLMSGVESQFGDLNMDNVESGQLYFYDNGTTTLKAIYSDSALQNALANPVSLTAAGKLSTNVYCPDGEIYTIRLTATGIDESKDGVWGSISDDPGAAAAYTASFTAAVSQTMLRRLDNFVILTDFIPATGASSNLSTYIQAAVDYLESVSGGELWIPPITGTMDDTVNVNANNIRIRGAGRGNTVLNSATGNNNTFYFGLANPDQNNLITNVAIMGLTIQKSDVNPTGGAHVYLDRARQSTVCDIQLVGGKYGVVFAGTGQQCSLYDFTIQPGSNVTSLIAGSAGILVNRRQVDASDPNAVQDSVDSLYYTEPNVVNIFNGQVFGSQYWAQAMIIHAADTLFMTAVYLGQCATAQLTIQAVQANMPLTSLHIVGVYKDPAASYGDYGLYIPNSSLSPTSMGRFFFTNCQFGGAQEDCVLIAEPGLKGISIGAECDISNAQKNGVHATGGEDLRIQGANFDSNNLAGSTHANVLVVDVNTLLIEGCMMQGAYRSIQVSASSATTRVNIQSNSLRGASDTPIYLAHDDDTNDRVGGNLTDTGASLASATTIAPPLGTDLYTITGTTNIQDIDDNVSGGRVNFDGRLITLIFQGVLDVIHNTGNIRLKAGSSLTTAAGTTLQLIYDSAGNVWREV